MNISTNRDFFVWLSSNINHGFGILKYLLSFKYYHSSIFFVQHFAIFLPLHNILNKLRINVINFVQLWSFITWLYWNIIDVDFNFSVLVSHSCLELSQFVFFHCFIVFKSSIFIVGLHFANTAEIFNS